MAKGKAQRVREQVAVYLDERDRALLEELTEKTGLPKTELFRRGLRRLADETLGESAPGSSLRHLVATAADDDYPSDVSEKADAYLYGREYDRSGKGRRKKRAGPG
jgi:hypothetical protein